MATAIQLDKFRTAACEYCDGTGAAFDHTAIGAHMRSTRERAGISLRQISRALDLSAAYVSDLELGRRNWTPERVSRYRQALKVAA